MGKIHDLFTTLFGSDRSAVEQLLWSLGHWSSPQLVQMEKELLLGTIRSGWKYVDMYIETVSYENKERVSLKTASIRRLNPSITETELCSYPEIRRYIDSSIIVEFKTRGSRNYPFDLGDTIRQLKMYCNRVRSNNQARGMRIPVIPVLLMPSQLPDKTPQDMEGIFSTLDSEEILYRSFQIKSINRQSLLYFSDQPRSSSEITARLMNQSHRLLVY